MKFNAARGDAMGTRTTNDARLSDDLALPLYLALPMEEAAAAPYPATVIRPLLQRYGFDGLTYLVGQDFGGSQTGQIVWSTYPPAWNTLYQRAAHVAVDPRLLNTRHRVTPYFWDAAELHGDLHLHAFVRDAAQHHIRSGVVISLHDSRAGHVALAFDSAMSPVPVSRRESWVANLGDLMLIAVGLHEGTLSWRIRPAAPRPRNGPALTRREHDCLKLAARGMTSADIGNKLSLSESTINFHFGNLRKKLGAINRPEAIAKGAALGLVKIG
jgi:LuxR family transcriptional regulator, quorum-sensing system regulator LasR